MVGYLCIGIVADSDCILILSLVTVGRRQTEGSCTGSFRDLSISPSRRLVSARGLGCGPGPPHYRPLNGGNREDGKPAKGLSE